MKVVDFFCGAGGFSEGFRQQGFHILKGYDNYSPAVETFNHNFNLNLKPKNILDFQVSLKEIETIPDTEIILGSPPCVSFSNSNKSGKADKSMGLRLTETFLRIVAVKKFSPNSKLQAWFMENVPNSLKYIKHQYTFKDLGLTEWSKSIGLNPKDIAINIKGNSAVINSADYGSPQVRKRAITGEIISVKSLVIPKETHSKHPESKLPKYRTLACVKKSLQNPFRFKKGTDILDPSYDFVIKSENLSDHFYDTGLYKCQWKNSEYLKRNHPYMGRMSFPENEQKPSRTICATNIGTSRESIIYKSELARKGDGEFRTHTVREAASLMGFPITFQFAGAESAKLRLVGNAVCPSVSRALASTVRKVLKRKAIRNPIVQKEANLEGINNLNSTKRKAFNNPPKKKSGSKFRRHPFKYGNITVTLSNYDISNPDEKGQWMTSVQYGNGDGYPSENYPSDYYKKLEPIINKFEDGDTFLKIINNGFSEKIAPSELIQKMYEERKSIDPYLEPTILLESVAALINRYDFTEPNFEQEKKLFFKHKPIIPKKQILALYAINKITSIANTNSL
ncbi:MAG: DNA cytosine methyltransferase [Ekhidna sp.]|uniref:DNA cytosine methyltransferase n=1 Tax=Ekhidna sp. TaxID=2608089 RepID=UPI0032EEDDB3